MSDNTVLLKIQADNKQALTAIDKINKKLGKTEEQGKKTNSVFSKMGAILGGIAIGSGLLAIGRGSVKVASDLQEAENKLNAVFGSKGQRLVNDFATRYRDDLGMSILETKNFIADAGNLFNGFGMGEDQARKFSTEVLKLTNDLASFNNLSTEDAQRKMMSALMGESESAKGLGASILEDQMKRASLALGLGKYSNKMDELTKIQIRYKAILMQSQKAVGDSARSNGSYVDTMKKFHTAVERVALVLGQNLEPIINTVVVAVTSLINLTAENIEVITALSSALATAGLAYLSYLAYMKLATIGTWSFTGAFTALNVVMKANVVGIVITAVSALAGWLVYLYNTNENVKITFLSVWYSIGQFIAKTTNKMIEFLNVVLKLNNTLKNMIPTNKKTTFEAIAKVKVLSDDEISDKIVANVLEGRGKVDTATGQGGSTTTSGGGLPYQAGTPANNVDGESYYKTFNTVGGSTTTSEQDNSVNSVNNKSENKVTTGDITINITQRENEDNDELLDRLTYRIANEFNRAGKIAGVI